MIKLPYSHVSHSQINKWNASKTHRAYIKQYFFKEKSFRTKELFFGGDVADELEKDDLFAVKEEYFDVFAQLPTGGIAEYCAVLSMGNYYVLSKLDRFDLENEKITEFKTGKKEWDLARLMKDRQTEFYSWLIYKDKGFIPSIDLYWMETENDLNAEFGIRLTGKVEKLEKTCTLRDIEATEIYIRETVAEISEGYKAFLDGEDLAIKYNWRM